MKEIIFIFLSHNSRLFLPSCFMQSPPNAAQSELPVGCIFCARQWGSEGNCSCCEYVNPFCVMKGVRMANCARGHCTSYLFSQQKHPYRVQRIGSRIASGGWVTVDHKAVSRGG